MRRLLALILVSLFAFAPHSAQALDAQIAWQDLIDPSSQTFEDPFRDLTFDQLDALRTIVRTRAILEDVKLSDMRRIEGEERVEEAIADLAEDGIDANSLIEQRWTVAELREQAAVAVNPEIDGADIALVGFAISAPTEEDGTTIVYLVPERGMCSHVPPPNPNQLIRARVLSDWQPAYLHEPVRLSGKITAEETRHSFFIVDGEVPMRASLIMEVGKVETVSDIRASMGLTKDDSLRRAESNKTGGTPRTVPHSGN